MKWIITGKKALASAVNVSIVFGITSPIYFFFGIETWRISYLILFFGYSLVWRERCLGQRVARTYQDQPTSPAYAALYTASTATLIFWVFVPLDLALANGLFLQLPCLMIWGNTPHGLIARRRTVTETERLWECVGLKGECPDCEKTVLVRNGSYLHCRLCRARFFADNFVVLREPPQEIKKAGQLARPK